MAKLRIDLTTTIEFQGGGLYDDNGQLIFAAKLLDQDAWLFLDTSRNIDGIIDNPKHSLTTKYPALALIDHINHRYLHNDYAYAGLEYSSEFQAMFKMKRED